MEKKKHILLVEDDESILFGLQDILEGQGYQISTASNGIDGLKLATENSIDLLILDIMLPGMNGLEICKKVKKEKLTFPIIMLTAKSSEIDKIAGLDYGADDYITKPFSPRVLLARIKAVLRRHDAPAEKDKGMIRIHDLEIDSGRHRVKLKNDPINLTSTEFALLKFLAARPGWVFTRYQMVDAVHGSDYPVTDRSVDVQIVGLRKKLGTAGKYIETVRGVGYRFMEEN